MAECQSLEGTISDEEIAEILRRTKTIAVVGISHKEDRDSHKVAKYLKDHGYRMIPVNPKYKEVLGETCYPTLQEVPAHIDLVDIFRNMEAIPGVVDDAIAAGADCVWMQLGLCHHEAAAKARDAGMKVVMNKCAKVEHGRLIKT